MCTREKYVTRAEFDDLKARFDQLQALVQRLNSSNLAYFPTMAVAGPVPEGTPQTYPSTSTSSGGLAGYATVMGSSAISQASPQAYLSSHVETSSSGPGTVVNRYIKPEEPAGPLVGGRHGHSHVLSGGGSQSHGTGAIPSGSGAVGSSSTSASTHVPGSSSGIPSRRIENSPTTSGTSGMKNSALSLSSITSPYHPQQKKTTTRRRSFWASVCAS